MRYLSVAIAIMASMPALAEWRTVELVDEFEEPLGKSRVYAQATFAGGDHWCRLQIDPVEEGKSWHDGYAPSRGRIGLRCDYFNLTGRIRTGGYEVRAKIADETPITVSLSPYDNGLGGRLLTFEVEGDKYETGSRFSQEMSFLHSFSDEIFDSIHDAGSIKISLPYYAGSWPFPLQQSALQASDGHPLPPYPIHTRCHRAVDRWSRTWWAVGHSTASG